MKTCCDNVTAQSRKNPVNYLFMNRIDCDTNGLGTLPPQVPLRPIELQLRQIGAIRIAPTIESSRYPIVSLTAVARLILSQCLWPIPFAGDG